MKIKARVYGNLEVIIIGFVSAYSHDVKAVYIDKNGKVGSCYLDSVEVIDSEYIPAK
jgi:hypothetical protein